MEREREENVLNVNVCESERMHVSECRRVLQYKRIIGEAFVEEECVRENEGVWEWIREGKNRERKRMIRIEEM